MVNFFLKKKLLELYLQELCNNHFLKRNILAPPLHCAPCYVTFPPLKGTRLDPLSGGIYRAHVNLE
jgi:hypothetical protein